MNVIHKYRQLNRGFSEKKSRSALAMVLFKEPMVRLLSENVHFYHTDRKCKGLSVLAMLQLAGYTAKETYLVLCHMVSFHTNTKLLYDSAEP